MSPVVWHQYNGHGSIFVLEDYPPYRKEVVRYLDLVGSTYSGHTLFKYCNILVDEFEIIPFVPTPSNPVNAETNYNTNDAFPDGQPVRDGEGTVLPGARGTGIEGVKFKDGLEVIETPSQNGA